VRSVLILVVVCIAVAAVAAAAAAADAMPKRPHRSAQTSKRHPRASVLMRRRHRRHAVALKYRAAAVERHRVVRVALRQVGVPYVWGGASRRGFDCSGLVRYVYQRFGVSLPHYTFSQFERGTWVPRRALAPGDLVFFHGLDHVGLYVGGGRVVHAPHTGTRVQVSPISWIGGYYGARRLIHV
jgi:cell wall-associated NlpC family hydrolase